MAKVAMATVYKRIVDKNWDALAERKSEHREALGYSFEKFSQDLRSGDLLTTTSAIKGKWDCMIADGALIVPSGSKAYNVGVLLIEALETRAHTVIPAEAKRVCVCVCNTNDGGRVHE